MYYVTDIRPKDFIETYEEAVKEAEERAAGLVLDSYNKDYMSIVFEVKEVFKAEPVPVVVNKIDKQDILDRIKNKTKMKELE